MWSTSSLGAREASGVGGSASVPEEETLRGCHLGGQSGAHGTLLLQGKGRGAVAGSLHDRLNGGMAMTSADEADVEAVTSAHVMVAWAWKPGGEPRRGWAARVASGRGRDQRCRGPL